MANQSCVFFKIFSQMRLLRGGIGVPLTLCLMWLFQSFTVVPLSFASSQQVRPEGFRKTTSSVPKPVYGPLALEIVHEFDLADKEGIAIDLGSGSGDLIISPNIMDNTRFKRR